MAFPTRLSLSLALYAGNTNFVKGLENYLPSRDNSNLILEFQRGNGKRTVYCIQNQPAVDVDWENMYLGVLMTTA